MKFVTQTISLASDDDDVLSRRIVANFVFSNSISDALLLALSELLFYLVLVLRESSL
jgi:hypothetical protein